VIDKEPTGDAKAFPPSPGMAPDVPTLLNWITDQVPPRRPIPGFVSVAVTTRPAIPKTVRAFAMRASSNPAPVIGSDAIELAYETLAWKPVEHGRITEALYEPYGLQSIRIPGAQAHPTMLVQSAAMASSPGFVPIYRGRSPRKLQRTFLTPLPAAPR
jgi:hypothetical protein